MVRVGAVTAAGVKGPLRRPPAALDPGSRGSGNATRCATPPETVTERHMLRLGTPPITTPPPPAPRTPRAPTGPNRTHGSGRRPNTCCACRPGRASPERDRGPWAPVHPLDDAGRLG